MPDEISITTVPLLSDNYGYLVTCRSSGKTAIVDPGEAQAVIAALEQSGLRPSAIWNTHHHVDHIAGNIDILDHFGELPVYGHEVDTDRIPKLTHPLRHQDNFLLGHLTVKVLHTPGHTRGGIVYLVENSALTGDALFGAGCGRLFEGDAATLYRSLNTTLSELRDDTRVYFGHEYTEKNLRFAAELLPNDQAIVERLRTARDCQARGDATTPSTWALEKATNPFLRCDDPDLISALQRQQPDAVLSTSVDRFSCLRSLRDHYR